VLFFEDDEEDVDADFDAEEVGVPDPLPLPLPDDERVVFLALHDRGATYRGEW